MQAILLELQAIWLLKLCVDVTMEFLLTITLLESLFMNACLATDLIMELTDKKSGIQSYQNRVKVKRRIFLLVGQLRLLIL